MEPFSSGLHVSEQGRCSVSALYDLAETAEEAAPLAIVAESRRGRIDYIVMNKHWISIKTSRILMKSQETTYGISKDTS